MREASLKRETKETSIEVKVNLDGTGKYNVETGIGFLDHMLEQLSRHSLIDITLKAKGDTHIDYHHTTEDSGLALGECISKALGNLNHVIHEEKIYRNPELTLTGLANRLDLTPRQLSELLNNEIGKNFNSYITDFRIEDAIEELKKNKYSTILSIALSVGFNSNSAFYSAFKKVTGKSPSDYREQ